MAEDELAREALEVRALWEDQQPEVDRLELRGLLEESSCRWSRCSTGSSARA